jgi:hypothetical protein
MPATASEVLVRFPRHPSRGLIEAVLAAAGYNFRHLLRWLRLLWLRILIALSSAAQLKLA